MSVAAGRVSHPAVCNTACGIGDRGRCYRPPVTDTRPVEWKKRARTLRVTGVLGLLAAVLLLITANFLPGLMLGVLGVGNLLAAKPVATTGQVPTPVRITIVVGGAGFVIAMLAGTVLALLQG